MAILALSLGVAAVKISAIAAVKIAPVFPTLFTTTAPGAIQAAAAVL